MPERPNTTKIPEKARAEGLKGSPGGGGGWQGVRGFGIMEMRPSFAMHQRLVRKSNGNFMTSRALVQNIAEMQ